MKDLRKIVPDELFSWMSRIRRTIHEYPEPGQKEFRTSDLISTCLDELGIDHSRGVGGTGIVGRISNGGSVSDSGGIGSGGTGVGIGNRTVALRADMDALPVSEATDLPFSSKNPGFMHACGHDGHVATLLGAAKLLKDSPPDGTVVLLFQPDEEGEGGAQLMIADGALKGVEAIFAAHLDNRFQVGQIALRPGANTAYTDAFDVEITGKGGHAARPQEAVDALLLACQMALQIQLILTRELDPLQPAVITIGEIKSGSVHNAIAEKAIMRGTIRTIDTHTRDRIVARLKDLAHALGGLYGATILVKHYSGYPPVVNTRAEYELARSTAEDLLGRECVLDMKDPSMGGEDFAYYLEKVPGCFFRLGSGSPGTPYVPLHSPHFDFNEEAMRIGAAFMAELVRAYLQRPAVPG
ncbi:MAG: amidohydrolase [Nitrospirae bacterium]|nr:amidohydrolase [Nitrospirota bacterium]